MIEIQCTTHLAISALDMYSKELKAGSQGDSCKSVFIVAVFMDESSQVEVSSHGRELNLCAHQQVNECIAKISIYRELLHAGTSLNLEDTVLSESQSQRTDSPIPFA